MEYKIKIEYNINENTKYAFYVINSETLDNAIVNVETNFNERFGPKGATIISTSQEI